MKAENYTKLLMLTVVLIAIFTIMFYDPVDTQYVIGERFEVVHKERVSSYSVTIIKDKDSGAEYMIIGDSSKPGVVKL